MAFRSYEELRVFQMAEQLADEVWQVVRKWKQFERSTLGAQLITAADSIGANIAEGAGRGTDKENQRFIRISRGSLNETKFWLRRAEARKIVRQDEIHHVKQLIDQLAPSLNAYLQSYVKKIKSP
jgi:four helix bundle protein